MNNKSPFVYRNFRIYIKDDNETFYYVYRRKVRAFKSIQLLKKSINDTIDKWKEKHPQKAGGK